MGAFEISRFHGHHEGPSKQEPSDHKGGVSKVPRLGVVLQGGFAGAEGLYDLRTQRSGTGHQSRQHNHNQTKGNADAMDARGPPAAIDEKFKQKNKDTS